MRTSDGMVTLREHRLTDADDMMLMGNDPDTAEHTTAPWPYERRHAEGWITGRAPAAWRDGTGFLWAVEAPDRDGRPRFAGNVDVRLDGSGAGSTAGVPDIGYALAPWARGRGIMSRAVRLAVAHAFGRGVPVVHWSCHAGHLASWRVAHACGFTFTGERPLSVPHRDGELRDGWFAALRPGDPLRPRTTWWPVPVLEAGPVRLRPHSDADLSRIVEACSDPVAQHWLPNLPAPYRHGDAAAFVRDARLDAALGRRVCWAVADRADDRLLGTVSVFELAATLDPHGGEIGYWAHPDARGRGVTTAAVRLAAAHALTPVGDGGLGRLRLQIGAAWDNEASRRVAERAGFTLVGHLHEDCVTRDGARHDGAWYERPAGG